MLIRFFLGGAYFRAGSAGRGEPRPYRFGGERIGIGRAEFKCRDLGSDRGYGVAFDREWQTQYGELPKRRAKNPELDVLVLHFVHEVVAGADG